MGTAVMLTSAMMAAACSDTAADDVPSGGAGAGGGGGGIGGTGGISGGTAGTGGETVPILERTPRLEHSCTTLHEGAAIGLAEFRGNALVATDAGFFVAGGGHEEIRFGTLATDGTFTPLVSFAANGHVGSVVPESGQFALTWQTWTSIDFARIDASGQVLVGPKVVTSTSSDGVVVHRLVSRAGGYALLWSEAKSGSSTLRFLPVDGAGEAAGPANLVATIAEGWVQNLAVVAVDSGYVVAWDQSWQGSDVYAMPLDGDGHPTGSATRLSPSGLESTAPALVRHGSGSLAAWREAEVDWEAQQGHAIIRVAQLDGDASVVGPVHQLQAPQLHADNTGPAWGRMGDDLVLGWSEGTIIYVCAGCIPDHRVKWFVIEPDELVRLSEVLTAGPPGAGQLDLVMATNSANVLLTLFNITYHGSSEPGSAAFQCE